MGDPPIKKDKALRSRGRKSQAASYNSIKYDYVSDVIHL